MSEVAKNLYLSWTIFFYQNRHVYLHLFCLLSVSKLKSVFKDNKSKNSWKQGCLTFSESIQIIMDPGVPKTYGSYGSKTHWFILWQGCSDVGSLTYIG
jgi:hypothetical protein